LSPLYEITLFYYNPNIKPADEYYKRAAELEKLPGLLPLPNRPGLIVAEYDAGAFDPVAEAYPDSPEGGPRCGECFGLRLRATAAKAKTDGFDCFATTLSVSPHKDAKVLNAIGVRLEGEYGVGYLRSDFKKRDGYKRSVELSKQYGLYRQAYCGCRPAKSW